MKSKTKRDYLIEVVEDYPRIDHYIHERRQELMNRYSDYADENVGGGRALNRKDDSTERLAITIAEDTYIQNLEINRRAVQLAIDKADTLTNNLIRDMYFIKGNGLTTMRDVAVHNNCSRTTASRLCSKFINDVAYNLGL